MKNLKDTISEKLIINKNIKIHNYNYQPKNRGELEKLVEKLIEERGNEANLNDIDTSNITDMYRLFFKSKFNGDISKWDVSNVDDMDGMFFGSKFTGKNGDISHWDVRNVKFMPVMFYDSKFNGDISNWNISNVTDMQEMFKYSPLEKNPPKWYKE